MGNECKGGGVVEKSEFVVVPVPLPVRPVGGKGGGNIGGINIDGSNGWNNVANDVRRNRFDVGV